MPLTKYQIRNEYSLADPDLYRPADKDDPEALLEGVAMSGLVGLLRQLGDLAQFAAEIFHDLHEEVMATAARGHGLMGRVQQLEAEFPSIEKAFLLQTNHSLFFTNSGVDWHPNLHNEHNLVSRGDLPRCVLDSYEECRGPPRLFLLDKFDVAGAGACLKRYTDPSFFKAESTFPGIASLEVQREKKTRKVKVMASLEISSSVKLKISDSEVCLHVSSTLHISGPALFEKKGSHWRNGETPEFVPTSHAKLHQLFLEESIGNAYNDNARLVKLKRRQLNGSPLDSKSGKSYMEKFLDPSSMEHKAVYKTSNTLPPQRLTLDNSSESGLEILEISTVSPVKNSSHGKETLFSSPTEQEITLKLSMEELNGEVMDREIVELPEPTANFTDGIPTPLHKVTIEKEITVDGEARKEVSIDGNHSDDMTSEVDNYMDALTTTETEMDTDNEYRPTNDIGFINIGKYRTGSDANEEKLEVRTHSLDSQSVGISSECDDGNSLFKKRRSILSYSDTVDNLAEDMPSDGEVAAKVFPSNRNCFTEIVDASSIQLPACSEMQCSSSDNVWSSKDTFYGESRLPDFGEASYSSCIEDLNSTHVLLDQTSSIAVSLVESESDEVTYDVKTNSDLSDSDGGKCLADSSEKQEVTLISLSESHTVGELDSGDTNVSSDALPHLSNILQVAPEKKKGNDNLDKVPNIVSVGESCVENSVNQKIGSRKSVISLTEEQLPCSTLVEEERSSDIALSPECLHVVKPVNLAAGLNSECMTPMVGTSQTCGFNEKKFSDILHDVPQHESDPTEGEGTREVTCSVKAMEGDAIPCDLPSHYADNLDLKGHVGLDDLAIENVLAESIAISSAACGSADFDDGFDNSTSNSSKFISSRYRNLINFNESLSSDGYLFQEGLESNEVVSQGCLIETREETHQVEGAAADIGSTSCKSVSCKNSNLEGDSHYLSLAEPTKNNLNFVYLTTALASSEFSDQESESKYFSRLMGSRADTVSSPDRCQSEKGTSLERSLDIHTNQHDVGSLHLTEDGSDSLILLSNQMQSLDHIDQQSCLQTSFEHSIEGSLSQRSLEFSQKSGRQDNQEIYSSGPINPDFGLLPEAATARTEEMPPLPPLPPMQWRIGRSQHVSPALQIELVEHGKGSFPMMPEDGIDEKGQFGLSALEQGTEHPRNPFLPLDDSKERSGHASDQLATDFMESSLFYMHPATMGGDTNIQYNDICIDRTHSNPFLTLPMISNESLEYGSIAGEGHRVESSYSLPMTATGATSSNIPISLHEKTTHPANQFVLDAGLEGGAFEHPKRNSEGVCGNPPYIYVPASTKRGEQIPTKVAEDLPTEVEEQFPTKVEEQSQRGLAEGDTVQTSNAIFQHGLAAPEEETAWVTNTTLQHNLSTSEGEATRPSNTFAPILAVPEDRNSNGNPTVKLPRLHNPLIDSVVALEKIRLRKVTERIRPPILPKVDERDSLLEQIRTKSFNLKPAVVNRPSIQGPKTNLRVAAILEKANSIRQALTGSDEDDDEDGWSDS